MTTDQKQTIRQLRKNGMSYKQIAEAMGISINTIKSFCHRDKEKNIKTKDTSNHLYCRYCGKPLVHTPGKRKKDFCNSTCRMKYWIIHRNDLPKKVTYSFKCAHCGKEFTIYGKQQRKYCSRKCYFADRFGE